MIQNEVVNRAIDYIMLHLNEEISVDDIASHCNFSKYYFSRVFKMETGEGIWEFIKRLRLEQSAFRLKIERDRSVTDISSEYGYSSSNYSSAFRQHYNLSPSEFRKSIMQKSRINPIFRNGAANWGTYESCAEKISIEILPDIPVIYQRHKGSYGDLSENWEEFLKKYSEYINEQTLMIERSYDDPVITDMDGCLYDIALSIPRDVFDGGGFENVLLLEGGRFAVYHFKGNVKSIYSAYQSIFNVWLPNCSYEIANRQGFDIYRKIDCDIMNMEIDICIPIE